MKDSSCLTPHSKKNEDWGHNNITFPCMQYILIFLAFSIVAHGH